MQKSPRLQAVSPLEIQQLQRPALLTGQVCRAYSGFMNTEQIIEHLETMTLTGAGADSPEARFGYDRARGELLNLLRTTPRPDRIGEHLHRDTQANEIGRLVPKPISEQVPGAWNFVEPKPPANGGGTVLNVTTSGHEINLVGSLEESLRSTRQAMRQQDRSAW